MKRAVKQLLQRLRPGDAATLIGFNETTFTVAERETDGPTREDAVDLLASWGGTALYDATIKALDIVQAAARPQGRRHLLGRRRPGQPRAARDGDGQGAGERRDALHGRVRPRRRVGGAEEGPRELRPHERRPRVLRARRQASSTRVFGAIVEELANQYVLSYSPQNPVEKGGWRDGQGQRARAGSTTCGRAKAIGRGASTGREVAR